MTFKKLAIYSLALWIILTFLKVWFFGHIIFANPGVQQIVFWLLLPMVGAAFVRRFGIINFFESFFATFVWVLGSLILDLLISSQYTGLGIFSSGEYWLGFLFFAVAIFFFHKKRHLQVRRELHAKAHAAAHPHGHAKPH